MRRRAFIAGLGSAAAWPAVARAQQPAPPVIGWLGAGSPDTSKTNLTAFRQGLEEIGYVEGRNVRIIYRWDEGHYDSVPTLAADLVRMQVAVIVVPAPANYVAAAKRATTTIPIVFSVASDPVELNLVTSLSRPGGNVTGFTSMGRELLAKRLEVLRQLFPGAMAIGLLVNPNNANTESNVREMQALAGAGGWTLHAIPTYAEADFATAFATLVQLQVSGALFATDLLFIARSDQLAAMATKYRMPAVHSIRQFVEAGGLISYGPSLTDRLRQVGIYTGRILKGEKPGDLPVQQPTKFELVINLKTAKTLGLTIPETLLATADEVIQ